MLLKTRMFAFNVVTLLDNKVNLASKNLIHQQLKYMNSKMLTKINHYCPCIFLCWFLYFGWYKV